MIKSVRFLEPGSAPKSVRHTNTFASLEQIKRELNQTPEGKSAVFEFDSKHEAYGIIIRLTGNAKFQRILNPEHYSVRRASTKETVNGQEVERHFVVIDRGHFTPVEKQSTKKGKK